MLTTAWDKIWAGNETLKCAFEIIHRTYVNGNRGYDYFQVPFFPWMRFLMKTIFIVNWAKN